MSLTPQPRKERSHGGNKVSSHSSAKNGSLSRTVSQYPRADPQRPPSASSPRTLVQDVSVIFAGAIWASWSKPVQKAWLSLVKEEKEKELLHAQCMMTQDTVTTTTTTTTSTVYGPMPRLERSYVVERVVQLESSRQQVVYIASGEGPREEGRVARTQ